MKRLIVLRLLVSLALVGVANDLVMLTLGGSIELWEKYLIAIVFTVMAVIDNKGKLE